MDYPNMQMWVHEGRERTLYGLDDHARPIGLVTCWRDDCTEEANVRALHDIGTHVIFHMQTPEVRAALIASGRQNLPYSVYSTMVYGSDGKGSSAYLLLFVDADEDRNLIRPVCRRIVKQYDQPGHVEWDGTVATFFDHGGNAATLLRAFDGTVECLDEWFSNIRPGFKALGTFDRNFSYVQQRWHETKPKQEGT